MANWLEFLDAQKYIGKQDINVSRVVMSLGNRLVFGGQVVCPSKKLRLQEVNC